MRSLFHSSGIGIALWTFGDMYNGSWVKDKRSGFGEYTWADGRKYVGSFLDHECHGMGASYVRYTILHKLFYFFLFFFLFCMDAENISCLLSRSVFSSH